MDDIAGVILAGGKSSRMGEDKAGLKLYGKTLLQHMEEILRAAGITDIYTSHPNFIADEIAVQGPLGGICAVLRQTQGHHTHLVFAPVDMPCLTPDLISGLINSPPDKALVHYESYTLPFRMAVDIQWLELADRLLRDGSNVSLRNFQAQIENRITLDFGDSDKRTFSNINTPEEWQRFTEEERVSFSA